MAGFWDGFLCSLYLHRTCRSRALSNVVLTQRSMLTAALHAPQALLGHVRVDLCGYY